jgi:hypothetical protein
MLILIKPPRTFSLAALLGPRTEMECQSRKPPKSLISGFSSDRTRIQKRFTHFRRTSVMPNPSVNLTRYGRPCKPGPRHLYYRRAPGLQALPTRAGYLER